MSPLAAVRGLAGQTRPDDQRHEVLHEPGRTERSRSPQDRDDAEDIDGIKGSNVAAVTTWCCPRRSRRRLHHHMLSDDFHPYNI